MKNKGVLISLAAILVIGILITKSTYQYIEKNSAGSPAPAGAVQGLAAETTAAAAAAAAGGVSQDEAGISMLTADIEQHADFDSDEAAMAEGAGAEREEKAMDGGSVMDGGDASASMKRADVDREEEQTGAARTAGGGQDMADSQDLIANEKRSADAVTAGGVQNSISPLDTAAETEAQAMGDSQKTVNQEAAFVEVQSYYEKRLEDLDIQIQKNKEKQTDVNANSSVKSAASNELKLWDSELNLIYNAILERLDKEDSEKLVEEQREWLKQRDRRAMKAAKKSAGGSGESIEYTISLTESTRERAYELAQTYAGQLLE